VTFCASFAAFTASFSLRSTALAASSVCAFASSASLIAASSAAFVPSLYCPGSVPSTMFAANSFASLILSGNDASASLVPLTVTTTSTGCLYTCFKNSFSGCFSANLP